jgi:hypothetical protein
MSRLYTYCIPVDDGAAPNPFWEICTLNICKPAIRRTANIGDWIVGTGSSSYGFDNKVVYAMKVTDKKTMEDYDAWTAANCQNKIPKINSHDWQEKLGDSIYDFSENPPKIRTGVHNEGNRDCDLSGGFALLSTNFFYFGGKPIDLPPELLPIVRQGRGHRVHLNEPYFEKFVKWIESLGYPNGCILSRPGCRAFDDTGCATGSSCRAQSNLEDERGGCD